MNKTTVLVVLEQQYEMRIKRIADIRYDTPDYETIPSKKRLHDRLFEEAKQLLNDMDNVKAMPAKDFALLYGN